MVKYMNRKKGQIFTIVVVALVFIVLALAYVKFTEKYNKMTGGQPIGKTPFAMLRLYKDTETDLMYIDHSAKLSLYQSIYDTAHLSEFN